MNVNVNFKWFFSVVFAIAIQVLFLRDIAIANVAFCFIYIWFLVKAPMQTKTWVLLVGAMFVGWLIDIFYNTHGMHAFACVLLAWLRPVYFGFLRQQMVTMSVLAFHWLK